MVSCFTKVWRRWVKICSSINHFFEQLFFKWAYIAGTHPLKVIFTVTILAIALTAGFARFNLQSQIERLYFPDTSRSIYDLKRAEKSFPQKFKPDEFIITMYDEKSSILNEKAFKTALRIHERLTSETLINTTCKKLREKCIVVAPLEIFDYNKTRLHQSNIKPTLVNALQSKTMIMSNGQLPSVVLDTVLGHLWYNTTDMTTDAVRMMYLQVFPETDEEHAKVSEIQKKMIEIFLEEQEKINAEKVLKLFFLTGRSIEDWISESSGGDIKLVVVSIALMCVFSTFVLISLRDPPGGHVLAANIGIACIALSIGSGFGLVMLSGQYFVAFVGTLSFLVLGVGIDDMFIILDALDGLPPEVTGIERLQKTLKKVGASVTMTTITNVVAFAISSSSTFPAIRYFCLFALTTILFSYFVIMTLLVAFLSFDIKRIEKGSWDIIPCKKTPNYVPWKTSMIIISKKLMRTWGRILMTIPGKACASVIAVGLLAAGIYGTFNLEEKFDLKQLAPDGSYFILFQDKQRFYFPSVYNVDVIVDDVGFDYTNKNNQYAYLYLDTLCTNNKYLRNNSVNWMKALFEDQNYNNSLTFYENLSMFLSRNPSYFSDIRFDETTNNIKYSRIICYDKNIDDWIFRRDSMIQTREDFDKKSNISDVFPISISYFYREQIASVAPETIQNLVLCSVAILVITTPYLVHPIVILLVFGGFVSLIVELFALMVIWGVALNSISMITSIMSIGFAVDYSAHVAHSYLLASGKTPEDRMIEALESIGSSVFMGGFTTFLGILVLTFGQSEIFRIFFKMVFGIVVLGLLNGLVFLPVFLTLFVRSKVKIKDEHQIENINSARIKTEIEGSGNDIVLSNPYSADIA